MSSTNAYERLAEWGPNELIESGTRGLPRIVLDQLRQILVLVLIVAAIVSMALGESTDALVIIAIVLLNTVLGTIQEFRAERAIAALKKLATPNVRVRRDGRECEITSSDLVPGDILQIEAGNIVPADARLLEGFDLIVEEAALTGESEPVSKKPEAIVERDVPLGDRRCLLFRGTTVDAGRGVAVVTETGMRTEIGKIAGMIGGIEREATPLQKRLAVLARNLAWIALALIAVVVVAGILRDGFAAENLRLLFLTGVSLAVAAVPEGLPAVVTIALGLGSQRMLRRKALIRKLPAVESLGSVTTICSDKTGTLTENKMRVTFLEVAGREAIPIREISDPRIFREPFADHVPPQERSMALLAHAMVLCNDARIESSGPVGDPTETALLVAGAELGLQRETLEATWPRVAEIPFSSERKRMTTIHRVPDAGFAFPGIENPTHVAIIKGAPDALLPLSTHDWLDDALEPLAENDCAERLRTAQDALASRGQRVLGCAIRLFDSLPDTDRPEMIESDLVFLGLVAMHDPPRGEARDAVAMCRSAGIRPVMITGDHPLTALEIARELDIVPRNDPDAAALTGSDLENLSEPELESVAVSSSVYARVAPEHKLRIVDALQKRGEIVAMTGDGVNDAPALKSADIGVAMGITGTDVAKETADMVLLDDNFATIVSAAKEGRVIFDNIRKFVKYTLSSNTGEILVMLIAPFLGMPLALLPVQILWINLVTDGLPGLALAVEPAERGIMKRPPFRPKESIFSRGLGPRILFIGILMGIVSLGIGWLYWLRDPSGPWQTMLFTTLTLAQLGNALAIRSQDESLFSLGIFSNRPLILTVALTFVLQILVIYTPVFQTLLHTQPLAAADLAIAIGASSMVFLAVEMEKYVRVARGKRGNG